MTSGGGGGGGGGAEIALPPSVRQTAGQPAGRRLPLFLLRSQTEICPQNASAKRLSEDGKSCCTGTNDLPLLLP